MLPHFMPMLAGAVGGGLPVAPCSLSAPGAVHHARPTPSFRPAIRGFGAFLVRRQLLPPAPVRAAGAVLAVVALSAAGTTGNIQAPLSVEAHFAALASYRANPGDVTAITYDPASVPVGARIRVMQSANKWGGMNAQLDLKGLRHDTGYRAYVNVGLCTADPGRRDGTSRTSRPPVATRQTSSRSTLQRTAPAAPARSTQRYWGIGEHQHALHGHPAPRYRSHCSVRNRAVEATEPGMVSGGSSGLDAAPYDGRSRQLEIGDVGALTRVGCYSRATRAGVRAWQWFAPSLFSRWRERQEVRPSRSARPVRSACPVTLAAADRPTRRQRRD